MRVSENTIQAEREKKMRKELNTHLRGREREKIRWERKKCVKNHTLCVIVCVVCVWVCWCVCGYVGVGVDMCECVCVSVCVCVCVWVSERERVCELFWLVCKIWPKHCLFSPNLFYCCCCCCSCCCFFQIFFASSSVFYYYLVRVNKAFVAVINSRS